MFVSDLDGTLFQDKIGVSERDKQALTSLYNQGVEICLASGRMDQELVKVSQELGFECHRVSQNGAFVRRASGKQLFEGAFLPTIAKKIDEIATGFDLFQTISIGQSIYTKEMTAYGKIVQSRMLVRFCPESY
nr:HAD hydrolase family protein [Brevibacillus laterosporus]